MRAGSVAVPVNFLLKASEVAHILRDSGARTLVTTVTRLSGLVRKIPDPSGLHAVISVDSSPAAEFPSCPTLTWHELRTSPARTAPRSIDTDVAALSCTSGSTGKPKGLVLSHRNMVVGARSVSRHFGNKADDRLLAVPSFSFD